MRERPILFSGPMVRAILDGRKTQTRRVMNPQPEATDHLANGFAGVPCWRWIAGSRRDPAEYYWRASETPPPLSHCPYGEPGDRLWVRESWAAANIATDVVEVRYQAHENASYSEMAEQVPVARIAKMPRITWPKWRPSIHMPRWACRLVLEVVSVRIERLNHCSEPDAKAEGLYAWEYQDCDGDPRLDGRLYAASAFHWREPVDEHDGFGSPINAYRDLWDRINGAGAWDKNPWVWVVEFKRVTP